VDSATSGPVTAFPDLETCRLVDPVIVNNITKGMGFTTMTEVQSKTINEALKGADM
jgi:ATP-dependent RNA helicase MSS116